jgi:hypothetical protein
MKSNLILPEDVQPYTADETLLTCPTLGCFGLLLSMPALLSLMGMITITSLRFSLLLGAAEAKKFQM